MPGPPPKKDSERRRRNQPARPWQPSPGVGWQHSEKIPKAPVGLMAESRKAWKLWFESWWASNWELGDLPQLQLAIRLHDQVGRGDTSAMAKFTPIADGLGLTPKGRGNLRWAPPASMTEEEEQAQSDAEDEVAKRRQARAARVG